MSTSDHYASHAPAPEGWRLHNPRGETLDVYGTEQAAEHAARLLNMGACEIDPLAPLGKRVVPRDA